MARAALEFPKKREMGSANLLIYRCLFLYHKNWGRVGKAQCCLSGTEHRGRPTGHSRWQIAAHLLRHNDDHLCRFHRELCEHPVAACSCWLGSLAPKRGSVWLGRKHNSQTCCWVSIELLILFWPNTVGNVEWQLRIVQYHHGFLLFWCLDGSNPGVVKGLVPNRSRIHQPSVPNFKILSQMEPRT